VEGRQSVLSLRATAVLGDLGSKLDLRDADRLDLIDQWLGINVH
jgi:hypothetical protein